jgi:hypothetical protein
MCGACWPWLLWAAGAAAPRPSVAGMGGQQQHDELLFGFARFTELWIEGPMRLLNQAEASSGLGAEQVLLLNLGLFMLISPLAALAVANASASGLLPKAIGFMCFYVWINVGMGVECRSGVTSNSSGVLDLGHELLTVRGPCGVDLCSRLTPAARWVPYCSLFLSSHSRHRRWRSLWSLRTPCT